MLAMQGSLALLPEPPVYVSQLGDNHCVIITKNCGNDLLAVCFNQRICGEGLTESMTGEQGGLCW